MPLDPRSDVYALGVLMYQMLTGKVPFDAEDQISILLQHCGDPPPPMEDKVGDTVPSELQAVVFKALMKDRNNRYQSTDELGAALADIATTHEWVRRTAIMPAAAGARTPTPMSTSSIPTPASPPLDTGGFAPLGDSPGISQGAPLSGQWGGDLGIDIDAATIESADKPKKIPLGLLIGGAAISLLLLIITIFHASSTLAPVGMVLRRPSTIRNMQLFIPCKLFTSEHTTNNNQTISARSVSRRVFDHIIRNLIY